ncbi:S8 family serine peptidase, partial [bacterium]|nr:S8 family serine peptidase [bacterium]
VANGTGLYSCTDSGDSSYASYSGTSMSTPNLAGALNLLVRHYEDTHSDETPLASTMKAVLVQTADEAGDYDGPDFKHGWGLLNARTAAELISDDGAGTELVIEGALSDGDSDVYYVEADGIADIRVTLAWTDPPGTSPAPAVDPTDAMLVNDLDLRLQTYPTLVTYQPYLLDPANPDNAPRTGDNARDITEQIFLDSYAGGEFSVVVSHKGTLAGPQSYSIVSTHELNSEPSGVDSDVPLGDSRILGISPNPFNPRTMGAFQLRQPAPVDIVVYDAAGRIVRMLLRASELAPGDHEIAWDGTDAAGKSVASGVYFCRLLAGEETDVRRVVLLK